jgi:glutamate 5-kinase
METSAFEYADEDDSHAASARPEWANCKRIVVKIGSALVVDRATGQLRATWLHALADDLARLTAEGREIVLVSSGAIALGRGLLGFGPRALELEESQAAAAAGQISLAQAYQSVFQQRGMTAAQILLTLTDTEERRRYLNARSTIETLLRNRAIPVVNENDTVATTEIRYGDNDRLSANVAAMITADALILLSDIDGMYSAPPHSDPSARRLATVRSLTPDLIAMGKGADNPTSNGGMITKLDAAKIAMSSGTHMIITSGQPLHPLQHLAQGAPATWFLADTDPVAARKRWIAGQLKPAGSLTIDAGAATALTRGKSLLPAGVTAVSGAFERGDAVRICTTDGVEIGRGLVAYSDADAAKLLGRQSAEIAEILGYTGRSALVHRDDMVLNRKATS